MYVGTSLNKIDAQKKFGVELNPVSHAFALNCVKETIELAGWQCIKIVGAKAVGKLL